MFRLNITVGGDVVAEARHNFIEAWHRAEAGEDFRVRRLVRGSPDIGA